MKLRFVVVAVALLLMLSATAIGQERMRFTRYVYGYKYTFKVFDEDLQKLPSWNPEAEDVPISVRKAIDIGKINLERLIPQDHEKWVLNTITLSRIGKDNWLYEIEFQNDELLGSGPDWTFAIFVKMDGTIVEPEVVPNDGKARVY
ncbi:MAG: hypothetical protein ACREBG_24235 [Pyrinomonadaceae bacterium]